MKKPNNKKSRLWNPNSRAEEQASKQASRIEPSRLNPDRKIIIVSVQQRVYQPNRGIKSNQPTNKTMQIRKATRKNTK
jgi:hypothetical protein